MAAEPMTDRAPPLKDKTMRELKAAMVARACEDLEPLRVAIEKAREVQLDTNEIDKATHILHDLELKTQPLTFTDLPQTEMQQLQAKRSRDEILEELKRIMQLRSKDGFRAEVLAEFHFQNFMFCQKQGFSPEKASAFLSLMRQLHSDTVPARKADVNEASALLEELLARHSRQLPPFSVGIFSKEEVSVMRDFVARSFLRHFKMYQFMYKQTQDIIVTSVSKTVIPKALEPSALHRDFDMDPKARMALNLVVPGTGVGEENKVAETEESRTRRSHAMEAIEAQVMQVMDEVVKDRLGDLESRMSTLP
eukprot:s855_g25.t1